MNTKADLGFDSGDHAWLNVLPLGGRNARMRSRIVKGHKQPHDEPDNSQRSLYNANTEQIVQRVHIEMCWVTKEYM